MSYETLEVIEDRDIVTVVLNRPDKRNAMSNLMKKELRAVAGELDPLLHRAFQNCVLEKLEVLDFLLYFRLVG